MNKKEERYIKDFKETFGESSQDKQSLGLVKKLKDSQKNAFPSKEFKKMLKNKLDTIYEIGLTKNEVPRWSIFQIFTVLGSFIFISGVLLIFLDLQTMDTAIDTENMEHTEIKMLKEMPGGGSDGFPQQNMRMMETEIMDEGVEDAYVPESYQMDELPSGDQGENASDEVMPSIMMESRMMDSQMMDQDTTQDEFRNICEANNGLVDLNNNVCVFDTGSCSYEEVISEENRCIYINE